MKISRIKILNVLGSRRIDMHVKRPITLLTGPNGTGKSSIQEAVRMALLGEILRVENKKDYPLMVADGAKSGSILVETDGNFSNTVELPKGDIVTADYGYPREVMASVLNAQRFATITPEARRKFLFDLTGCHATKDKVKTMLVEDRACDPVRVEAILAMMSGGFPAACDYAKKKSTEAKGSWRAMSGETYGSVKAASWKATAPEVDVEALKQAATELAAIDSQIAEIRREIAIIQGKQAERNKNAAKLAQAKEKAGQLAALKKQLADDETKLADATRELAELEAAAGTAPRAGLLHDMARFITAADFLSSEDASAADELMARYETEYGPLVEQGDEEARAQLPAAKRVLADLNNVVTLSKRRVNEAEAAQSALAAIGEGSDAGEYDTEALQVNLKQLTEKRASIAVEHDRMKAAADAADNAGGITQKAAAYHADVAEWTKIADALAPEGIPGELLATALKPINGLLRKSASATGWKQVAIAPDMSICADGRRYALLSESEKWRVDAMIAEAIAQISDIRVLMLDRVDVLDLPSRIDLLTWLDEQAQAGALESVLLFGTFKALPTGLPDSIEALWVENGEIREPALQAA